MLTVYRALEGLEAHKENPKWTLVKDRALLVTYFLLLGVWE
jgi:hypothetical protein